VEAVEDFIAIGKDVNAADAEARTPLHFACGLGSGEIVGALLEAGSALEATDSKGNTPLHYAAGYGRVAVRVGGEEGVILCAPRCCARPG
jgi:ankyrin repeat protein